MCLASCISVVYCVILPVSCLDQTASAFLESPASQGQPSWFHAASDMTVLFCSAAAGVRGRSISLKLKRRKTNAPDPPKFMGHGDCDNMSRSVTLSRFTDAASELGSQGKALLRALRVDPTQIRGIGLNVSTFTSRPILMHCLLECLGCYAVARRLLMHACKHCTCFANRRPNQVPTQCSRFAERIPPENIACFLLTGDKAGHRPSLSSRQARQCSPLQGVCPPSLRP